MSFRHRLTLTAATAVFALAACGDDAEAPVDAGATTETTASGEMTAGEFIAASIPDQVEAVEELVADHPEDCADVDPKAGGDFQVAFAIDAAQASPETPLSELIGPSCAEAGNGTS